MCNSIADIKLCSCQKEEIKYRESDSYHKVRGKMVKIANTKNNNIPIIYIWNLIKIGRPNEDFASMGKYMFPNEDIGNGLNSNWIVSKLNAKNCFDFDYYPAEGDNLKITQNIVLAPYLSFIFNNDKWTIDHYDQFSNNLEFIKQGKLTISE